MRKFKKKVLTSLHEEFRMNSAPIMLKLRFGFWPENAGGAMPGGHVESCLPEDPEGVQLRIVGIEDTCSLNKNRCLWIE